MSRNPVRIGAAARRGVLVLLTVLLVVGTSVGFASAHAGARWKLSASQVYHQVTQGQTVEYKVKLKRAHDHKVQLKLTRLPDETQVSLSRQKLTKAHKSVTVKVETSSKTKLGYSTLKLRGMSASGRTYVVTLLLNVLPKPSPSMSVSPGSRTVTAGGDTFYTAVIDRPFFVGPVALSVTGLPTGTTAAFQNAAAGKPRRLTIDTAPSTPPGTYTLTVKAKNSLDRTLTDTVKLVVKPVSGGPQAAFSISGTTSAVLAPGVSAPLNLSLTNPGTQPISITGITVAIAADPMHACVIGTDVTLTQIPADRFPLPWIPAGATRTLADLGLVAAYQPIVSMINTVANQDGCKNATLALSYTGTAVGGI